MAAQKINKEVPTFLTKIYSIIDEAADDLIHWGYDGKSFVVKDPKRLAKEVLPQFFKTANFNSFVRQLNFYGFRKINFDDTRGKMKRVAAATDSPLLTDEKCWEFCHPCFIRGRQDLLKNIKRKTYADATVASKDDLELLRSEVEQRGIEIESNESRMRRLETLCEGLQSEMRELKQNYERRVQECERLRPMSEGSFSYSKAAPTTGTSKLLDDPLSKICWKFDEPCDWKLDDISFDDSLLAPEAEGEVVDSNIPDDVFSSMFDNLMADSTIDENSKLSLSPLIETDDEHVKEDEEPRAKLEATLASMPSQVHQKEFLVKLVNTIKEMFPEVGSMFTDKESKDRSVKGRIVASPPFSPSLSRSNSNTALARGCQPNSINPTPAQIEMAQQQAISMMAALLPRIQMSLLNIVAASAMSSVSMAAKKASM